MKLLLLLLAVCAHGNVRGAKVAVPRLTVAPMAVGAPSLQLSGGVPLAPPVSAPSLSVMEAPLAAPAAAPPAARIAGPMAAPARTADSPLPLLGVLGITGSAAPGAVERGSRDESARLDALFEGRADRAASDDVFAAVPGAMPPSLLLQSLPKLDHKEFVHPERLYRRFQRVRKARETAYWTAAVAMTASGGLALSAAYERLMPLILRRDGAAGPIDSTDDVPSEATILPPTAPEHAVIREALEELDRRVGRKGDFGLTVVSYPQPYLQAFAGQSRDGNPYYRVSADFARLEGLGGSAAAAAILAHEHAHVYKNDVAHLSGAGAAGWKGLRPSLYAAAGLLATKAVILSSPLMALPYAEEAAYLLLGAPLTWTLGLLALFLAASAAYALLDAAVYRVIEYEADYFAAAHTRPEWKIAALEYLRLYFPDDGKEGLFALHPTLTERIERLKAVFERGEKP